MRVRRRGNRVNTDEPERNSGSHLSPATTPNTPRTTLLRHDAPTYILPHQQRFGSFPEQPEAGTVRLVFSNVDGFPSTKQYNAKVKLVRDFVSSLNADILGACEHNLHLKALGGQRILRDWFRSELPSSLVAAHNKHSQTSTHQYGGTMLLATGDLSDKIRESGQDPSGLGRWCWLYVKGREHGTRIISAYRPNVSARAQHFTVYTQHRQYLESLGDDACPREAFFRDLFEEISTWQTAGDRIILMADFNEDIRRPEFTQRFRDLALVEMILSKHPSIPAPATFVRGDREGTKPIDGIWASAGFVTSAAGYCTVQESPGDHRAMVIDLPALSLYGSPLQRTVRPPSRKLNCTNVKAREQYCDLLVKYC